MTSITINGGPITMETTDSLFLKQPVKKVFLRYFFPSMFGLMVMAVNILIDGIFIGHGVGEIALAGVNVALPVFSLIFAIALWIGMGGGTLYSMHLGRSDHHAARSFFSLSVTAVITLLALLGFMGYVNMEAVGSLLGANSDTAPFAHEYLSVMFLFGWIIALEQVLSIFVRNDGSPILSMISLVVMALVNIGMNYLTIFVWGLGVTGAAFSTVTGGAVGVLILLTHFMKKESSLRKPAFAWSLHRLLHIFSIGFPSLLAEMGMFVFVAGYNVTIVHLLGTDGVAAFSVINYLHSFMFITFFGIEAALQPMISFYHGARETGRIKDSVRIGEKAALILGVGLTAIGLMAAPLLVSLFGIESEEVRTMAIQGLRLFFLGYLFLGFNFVYMTYFQATGQIGASSLIILLRGFIFLITFLLVLPALMGSTGVWLALPFAELTMTALLFFMVRKRTLSTTHQTRESPIHG
ncbi:MATE family efflux transporter [Rossellomorea marisflavi]|nr:MATE family efflux transporter [Rossellomorea marisflavi]